MRKLKGFVIGLLVGLLIGTSALGVLASTGNKNIAVTFRNIKILIDGKQATTDKEPFIYGGNTYVPLRFISESLGKDVAWDNATNTVSIGKIPTVSRNSVYITGGNWLGLSAVQAIVAQSGYETDLQQYYLNTDSKYVAPKDKTKVRAMWVMTPTLEVLPDIYTSVRDGANAVIFVNRKSIENDSDATAIISKLNELFGVSIVTTPNVITKGPVDGGKYCSIFQGLMLNCADDLSTYLVPSGATTTVVGSMQYGSAGTFATSVITTIGSGKCLIVVVPSVTGYGGVYEDPSFSDANIDSSDNRAAAKKLVDWLVTPNQ